MDYRRLVTIGRYFDRTMAQTRVPPPDWRKTAAVALVTLAVACGAWWSGASESSPVDGLVIEVAAAVLMIAVTTLAHVWLHRRTLISELARRRGGERDARALALRDPLTGLANRRAMTQIGERHRKLGQPRALLLCDLDGFKPINDTHGHRAGDLVLRHFARRLAGLSYAGASLEPIRLGGDEFVLLATGPALDPSAIARDILRATAAPFQIDDGEVSCSTSIGIAQAQGGESLDELLAMADDAMYQAKRSGVPIQTARGDAPASEAPKGRRMFEQQIDVRSSECTLYAAAFGIDRIGEMRRALGYGLGSRLVRELIQRLGRIDDQLSFERLSPDVLGVAFSAPDRDAARVTLERLRAGIEGAAQVAGASVDVRLTIGVAGPGEAGKVRDLTEQAQAALEEAWSAGERFKTFEDGAHSAASDNIILMADLRDALSSGALEMHYQPKVRTATGRIESLEALIRWDHQRLGSVEPARFIPVAEKTGDIRELTDWVIDRVLADRARLPDTFLQIPIFINISAQLIGDEAFAESLLKRLLPLAGAIGIEITETAVLANPERALRHLTQIAAAGVKIAIDDYGVGLSSLSYLKQLPASELKLDKLFIADLGQSDRNAMIVQSTINLAHGLGLLVTAEGVGSEETRQMLEIMGCDLIQGFGIARPVPIAQISSLSVADPRQSRFAVA